jgi:hypothetical protein
MTTEQAKRRPAMATDEGSASAGAPAPSMAEQAEQARERVLAARSERAEQRRQQHERESRQGTASWLEE